MATAREKMLAAAAKLPSHSSTAAAVGATYKFELSGEGGGTFLAKFRENPSITEEDGPADCTLKLAASDFVDLLEGRAQAQMLFFGAKLQIEGDIGLAMKLEALTALLA
jgi:putative sterol carrier protein